MYSGPSWDFTGAKEWAFLLSELIARAAESEVVGTSNNVLGNSSPLTPSRQLSSGACPGLLFWPSFIIWRRMGREREGQKEKQLQRKGAVRIITFSLLLPSFSHTPFLLSPQWKINRGCNLLLLIQIDVYPEEDKTHFTSLSSGGRGKC